MAMDTTLPAVGSQAVVDLSALSALISALRQRGFHVIGPAVRDGAITCDSIEKLEDLPVGWGDEQQPGHYRLRKRQDGAVFGYACGAQGWKRHLHPPELRLFEAERQDGAFKVLRPAPPSARSAFLGVRACELAAIATQDRIFLGDRYVDAAYRERRQNTLIIAVNCTEAGANCFCASMKTGPCAQTGFDLSLTELIWSEDGAARHEFLVEVGSPVGGEILAGIDRRKPRKDDLKRAQSAADDAAAHMGRSVDTEGLHDVLYDNFEHPRWDRVAARCLSCANCTMVCPTCFCTTVEDATDVGAERAERWRKWDSCFTDGFSYIHGGSVRLSVKSRYRQWLTHKFAAWVDQFGSFGCVGCGRCITWCPGKIDITEEVRALRGVSASA